MTSDTILWSRLWSRSGSSTWSHRAWHPIWCWARRVSKFSGLGSGGCSRGTWRSAEVNWQSSAEMTREVDFPCWELVKWLMAESSRTRAHPSWALIKCLLGCPLQNYKEYASYLGQRPGKNECEATWCGCRTSPGSLPSTIQSSPPTPRRTSRRRETFSGKAECEATWCDWRTSPNLPRKGECEDTRCVCRTLVLYRLFNNDVVGPGIVGPDAKATGPRSARHLSGPDGAQHDACADPRYACKNKRRARDITHLTTSHFLTFIIHVNTNNFFWVILKNNADRDCVKTPILREILRIQNPLLEEQCAFQEVLHLFQ